MRALVTVFSLLALVAGAAMAGVAPERAAVNPATGDPIAVRPADPIPMDAPANTLSGTVSRAVEPPLPLPVDGTWYMVNCDGSEIGPDTEGGWQNEPCSVWEVSSPWRIVLLIADFLVVGDRYDVWVDGAYAGRTGRCLDDGTYYGVYGVTQDYTLTDQSDGCTLWNEPDLSTGVVVIPAGTHTVEIKCHRFAAGYDGSGCIIKAEERWARCPMEYNGGVITMQKIGGAGEESTSWGELKTLFR